MGEKTMPIVFQGNEKIAYRDPACYYYNGKYHLFFTVSEKENGYMFNRVAYSMTEDMEHFTEPVYITEKDNTKNFCSPGNVIKHDDEYLLCVTSYPMPYPFAQKPSADDTARLFFIKTKDFLSFSAPERIYPKGENNENEGRMIDPFVFRYQDEYRLFFKQNGVSVSRSSDLKHWEFMGHTDGGENACVIKDGDRYLLLHSPQNGIGIKTSYDLTKWKDIGTYTLEQQNWEFASGRLTAAFAMPTVLECGYRYIVFFHGSRADSFPETHGSASLAFAYTNDFETYFF
jgi:sucrose-6-phosphate hydrolase SacC (GH32 family)